jgi:hypothetical protein
MLVHTPPDIYHMGESCHTIHPEAFRLTPDGQEFTPITTILPDSMIYLIARRVYRHSGRGECCAAPRPNDTVEVMTVRSGQKAHHQVRPTIMTHKHDNSTAHCAQPLRPVAQHNSRVCMTGTSCVNVICLGSYSHGTPRTFVFHQLRVRFLNRTHWM